jgi:hypothetical protein
MSLGTKALLLSSSLLFAAATPAMLGQARDHLRNMSESQRARIQSNYEQFQNLSAEEKEQLRRLHAELEALGQEATELKAVLHQYAVWLDTLAPADRKLIAAAATTEERLQKVISMIDTQNATLEKDLKPFWGPPSSRDQGQSRLRRSVISQVYKSFEELNETLKPKVNAIEKQQLAELGTRPSLHRGALLLALKRKYKVQLKSEIPERIEEFMDERFADTFFQLLGLKTYAVATAEEKEELRRFLFDILLFPPIEPSTQLAFLESLDPEQREELRRIERIYGEAYPLFVRVLYYREHPKKLPSPLQNAFDLSRSLRSNTPPGFPLDRRPRWDGPRPPQDRPPPDRLPLEPPDSRP